ncbi:MAG: exo-alpha-sialidase [Planctomycetota bacterium]|nr:exo-alpha-sialidase [Planctomycetota bacterium]
MRISAFVLLLAAMVGSGPGTGRAQTPAGGFQRSAQPNSQRQSAKAAPAQQQANAENQQLETEILNITVGQPTRLSDLIYQNSSTLAVSRTGVLAAFYPKKGTGPNFYRTSTDLGRTWGQEMAAPGVDLPLAGGTSNATLRDGGVLKFLTTGSSFKGEAEFRKAQLEGEYVDGWFTLHSTFAWFNDDFTEYEIAPVQVYLPDAVTTKRPSTGISTWPIFSDKIIQLPNGDLLTAMQGLFKGDSKGRTIICVSRDQGHKWRYYATVAYDPQDPNPDLPGQYLGFCEPTLALLSNGQMICVMRTQYAHPPAEYKPMAICRSDDQGKTWTKPVATEPHLMNISPTLATLDNGVVACQYGRPGFHVAFSLDHGHTWRDRISFSHQVEPTLTGQFDMIKAGPNELVAIGSDDAGLKVWPISVERVKVSPARVAVTGRVVDEWGLPVAGALVEQGPNRYAADDWVVDPLGWDKRVRHGNDHPERITPLEYLPQLSYRAIQKINGHPTTRTDEQGRYMFEAVELGEYVLTVEGDAYAPQHRHVKVGPQSTSVDFILAAGRGIRGQVVDGAGEPIGGACVVLNRWHCHTDPQGYFQWSVASPVPRQVQLQVYQKYNSQYETLQTTIAVARLESRPLTLQKK